MVLQAATQIKVNGNQSEFASKIRNMIQNSERYFIVK